MRRKSGNAIIESEKMPVRVGVKDASDSVNKNRDKLRNGLVGDTKRRAI